jgi:tRNA-dihydrouridine synthase C
LLDEPELLYRIVLAVRSAVPAQQAVSAKMRLGLHDDTRAEACALAIEAAGASEIVVHARTKLDGYRPPAYWERIADIRAVVQLPLVANGEIWTVADAMRCRSVSGCQALMLGRGMVANPGLAQAIRCVDGGQAEPMHMSWHELLGLIEEFWRLVVLHLERDQQTGRLKQWLNLMRRVFPEAQDAFLAVKTFHNPNDVVCWLQNQRQLKKYDGLSLEPG